jgi:glycosyltransferase involved in cell wall biosynthesis
MVVLPDAAEPVLPREVGRISYPSRFPSSLLGIVWIYLRRILQASGIARRTPAPCVFSSSSLLHDVLPAWIHRWRHGSKMVVWVFHLVPKRKAGSPAQWVQFLLSSWAQRLCLSLYRRADFVFAGNALVRDALQRHGVPAKRMAVYYPAINASAVQAATPIGGYDALFIGRMVTRKGIFDILEAIQGLNIKVGMVGDGEDRESLETRVREAGLANYVDVLGALPEDRMYGLLKGCRFFLFPSYEEGYGIVIAEAMLAGKPVITYALPHYPETFGTGLITVPVGDRAALRDAVHAMVEGKVDTAACVARYREVTLFSPESAAEFCLAKIQSVD